MSAANRIAIVGASLAGVRTIKALRRKGFDGEVVLIGAEDELPYDRPPLSKGFLTATGTAEPKLLEPESFYDDVDMRLGVRATGLSLSGRRLDLSDGTEVVADHIVLATGAQARALSDLPDGDAVARLRTLADARRVRTAFATAGHILVLGGGFIGCEVAAAARARGLEVTIVEPALAPVIRGVGDLVGGTIAALHRGQGVDFRLGVMMRSVEDLGRQKLVTLSDGSTVLTDFIVVGVGASACVDWLQSSGLNTKNGILCDHSGAAIGGDRHVWAAGDVAAWPRGLNGEPRRIEHWTNAAEQAGTLASSLLEGGRSRTHDPVPYVWSDQYQHKIQILGNVNGEDDTTMLQGSLEDRQFALAYSRNGIIRGLVAFDMPQEVAAIRPLIANSASLASVA